MTIRRCLILLCVGIGACAPTAPPEESFAELEARLLAAESIRIGFDATAEGAVTAALNGELTIADGNVLLTASGDFDGEPAMLRLRADAERYTYGNAAALTMNLRPSTLVEALVIGFTRMGILHNLARLTSASPPDHANGGVREWVTVDEFARAANVVSFDLTVAGSPAGMATLTLDERGLPVERHQTVPFPQGEMRVVETYREVAIVP